MAAMLLTLLTACGTEPAGLADSDLTGEAGAHLGLSIAALSEPPLVAVGAPGSAAQPGQVFLLDGPALEPVATIAGTAAGDGVGFSVADAGDLDGDGFSELLVGAWSASIEAEHSGAAGLFYGPVSGTIDFTDADALLLGAQKRDAAGFSVAATADGDLIVGAPFQDDGGSRAGTAYLVAGPVSGAWTLPERGIALSGAVAYDESARAVSTGDLNGDGVADVVVGADAAFVDNVRPGLVAVFWGPIDEPAWLTDADALLLGVDDGDRAGASLAVVGDTDRDGRDDLLVGVYPLSGSDKGWAYLMTTAGAEGGTWSLRDADAILLGTESSRVAVDLGPAGDVDQDGFDDMLLVAARPGEGHPDGPATWIAHGPLSGSARLVDHATALTGPGHGVTAASAGDLDQDGWLDLIVGDPDDGWGRGRLSLAWGPL